MDLDLDALTAAASAMASSTVSFEMAVRLGESLEVTDGLWDLVAVVAADSNPVAQPL